MWFAATAQRAFCQCARCSVLTCADSRHHSCVAAATAAGAPSFELSFDKERARAKSFIGLGISAFEFVSFAVVALAFAGSASSWIILVGIAGSSSSAETIT